MGRAREAGVETSCVSLCESIVQEAVDLHLRLRRCMILAGAESPPHRDSRAHGYESGIAERCAVVTTSSGN